MLIAIPLAALVDAGSDTATSGPLRVAQTGQRSATQQRQASPAPAAGNPEIEGQIADLRRRLNITAPQQAQFDAFAQVMRQNAEEMNKLAQQQQQTAKPNAVDALRASERLAQAEAEALGRMLPPLQALYDTLSDQQKRAADQAFASGPEAAQPAPRRR